MRLTHKNYYSREANERYMSASQFKAFRRCQSSALAELHEQYAREKSLALLVGSYADSALDGKRAFEEFIKTTPEIYKRDGTLKSEFLKAQEIVERIKAQPEMMRCLSGKKQKIMTGFIGGVPFKIKMDSFIPGQMICDLKTTKDFNDIYVAEQGRLRWWEAWGYDTQGAIYREIVRQNTGLTLPFVVCAATKETVVDLDLFEIPKVNLDYELERVQEEAPLYLALKNGLFEPERCEQCSYCKSTKVISGIRQIETIDSADDEDFSESDLIM